MLYFCFFCILLFCCDWYDDLPFLLLNKDVRIIAVETDGAASFAAAQLAGEPVVLPGGITSIATSLGALAVTQGTLVTANEITTESMVGCVEVV